MQIKFPSLILHGERHDLPDSTVYTTELYLTRSFEGAIMSGSYLVAVLLWDAPPGYAVTACWLRRRLSVDHFRMFLFHRTENRPVVDVGRAWQTKQIYQ